MSVNWAAKSTVEDTLKPPGGHGVVSITAEICWSQQQNIEYTPKDGNLAHCEVVGKKGQLVRHAFRDGATWLRRPTR